MVGSVVVVMLAVGVVIVGAWYGRGSGIGSGRVGGGASRQCRCIGIGMCSGSENVSGRWSRGASGVGGGS